MQFSKITREANSTVHAVQSVPGDFCQPYLQQQIHYSSEQREDWEQVEEPGSPQSPFQPDSLPEKGHHVEVEV